MRILHVTHLRKKSPSRSIFRTSHTCREGKTVRHLGVDIGASQMPGSEVGMRFCHSASHDRRCEGPREGLEIPVSRVDLSELEGNPRIQRGDILHLEVTLSRSCLSDYCLVGRLRTPLQLCIHAVATASAKSSGRIQAPRDNSSFQYQAAIVTALAGTCARMASRKEVDASNQHFLFQNLNPRPP